LSVENEIKFVCDSNLESLVGFRDLSSGASNNSVTGYAILKPIRLLFSKAITS